MFTGQHSKDLVSRSALSLGEPSEGEDKDELDAFCLCFNHNVYRLCVCEGSCLIVNTQSREYGPMQAEYKTQ